MSSEIRLERLHDVIQCVMGWENRHPHRFLVGEKSYGIHEFTPSETVERQFNLCNILTNQCNQLKYEYDFLNHWVHLISIEEVLVDDFEYQYPVCLCGENTCPPEDSGGVQGYQRIQKALKDSKHPDHGHVMDWIGDDLKPFAFDLNSVNRVLVILG